MSKTSSTIKYKAPNPPPEHPRMKEFLDKQSPEIKKVFEIAKESLQSSFIPHFTSSFKKFLETEK